MALFRFHRGSLDESMKTVVEVEHLEDLAELLFKNEIMIPKQYLTLDRLVIKPYGIMDERIGWDTHIVQLRVEHDNKVVIGFLNKNIVNKKEYECFWSGHAELKLKRILHSIDTGKENTLYCYAEYECKKCNKIIEIKENNA